MNWGFIVTLLIILLLVTAILLVLRLAMRTKRSMRNRPNRGSPLLSESYEKKRNTNKQPEAERLHEQEQLMGEETASSPVLNGGALPLTQRSGTEAERTPEPEQELIPQPKHELMAYSPRDSMVWPKLESMLQPKGESPTNAIEVTAEELYSTYNLDKVAADANLRNSLLEVTGVVDRIVVKKGYDAYYIILSSAAKKEEWNVRCIFEKKDGTELNRLIQGQTVTVHGKYDGYKLNIILRDCVLITSKHI